MIYERQREGIEFAKMQGVYKGGKATDESIIEKAREKIAPGVPLAKAASVNIRVFTNAVSDLTICCPLIFSEQRA